MPSFNWRYGLGLLALTGACVLCGMFAWLTLQANRFATLSSHDSALHQTQELLAIIEQHPNGPKPQELTGYVSVSAECLQFLQVQMALNANQYTLAITDEYDSSKDHQAVHSLIEIWLTIHFPNGKHAEMFYLQGGLTGCRER